MACGGDSREGGLAVGTCVSHRNKDPTRILSRKEKGGRWQSQHSPVPGPFYLYLICSQNIHVLQPVYLGLFSALYSYVYDNIKSAYFCPRKLAFNTSLRNIYIFLTQKSNMNSRTTSLEASLGGDFEFRSLGLFAFVKWT